MRAAERILPSVRERMRQEIGAAGGAEVLFVGRVDPDGGVKAVTAAARGDESSVPALMPHMEKGDVILHNHPGGSMRPSRADIRVASELGARGIGFFIVDNEVEELYVVAEPVLLRKDRPLDLDALAALLEPGGALEGRMDTYEARDSQIGMLRLVAGTFNQGGICAAEAGTGVGKSLAYLIPALGWAGDNEGRVVVSTATINLQEQLMDKDIPLVRGLLGRDVPAVLVKGRGNYICLSRLREALDEKSLFQEDDEALDAVARWAGETATGSRSDLPFQPPAGLWSRVCSEADSCTGLRCPHREKCFFLKARREAAAARVLVVNHHLLFSDLALRVKGMGFETTAVLPPFRRVVFDEAHNIENSATSFFSETLSRPAVHRYMGRLVRTRGRKSAGLFPKIAAVAAGQADLNGVLLLTTGIREAADALESSALGLLQGDGHFRLTGETLPRGEETFLPRLWDLQRGLFDLIQRLGDIIGSLAEEDRELPEVYETRMLIRRLEGLAGVCEQFRNAGDRPDRVFWIEKARSGSGDVFLNFVSTPLEIAGVMREAVFEPLDSVVLTSATLTVGRSFRFWKTRVGLEGLDEVREEIFDSPFNYRENVLIGVPDDAPPPEDPGYGGFLSRFITDALLLAEGGALVLFTSYEMLRRTCEAVRPAMDGAGISLLRQGDDERSRLLRRFNDEISSVLFATDSFWEGVDSPGSALKLVILCRLPFRVPTDPVLTARMELVRLRGGNPFMDLSLPEAVMKFKQGFGRLMRRSSDRGAVLVADGRLLTKNYGGIFLASLPETRRSIKSSASLLVDLENFLASAGPPPRTTRRPLPGGDGGRMKAGTLSPGRAPEMRDEFPSPDGPPVRRGGAPGGGSPPGGKKSRGKKRLQGEKAAAKKSPGKNEPPGGTGSGRKKRSRD